MNDKQTINELLKTHADDTNENAKLLIENALLREAIKATLTAFSRTIEFEPGQNRITYSFRNTKETLDMLFDLIHKKAAQRPN